MKPLTGKVAMVTGASRGVGKGIALVLGEAGATVYVTGRSIRNQPARENASGTIDDTVDAIKTAGGEAVAVQCDHTVDGQITALFEQVNREAGRLDILVNNAWGGYEGYISHDSFDDVFWRQPLTRFDKMWTAGVRSNFVTTQSAMNIMLPQEQGVVINTSLFIDQREYQVALPYCMAKLAINYMTLGMGTDLRKAGSQIAVVGLALGWVRKEERSYTAEEYEHTASAAYIGRAALALATDPNVLAVSGQTLGVGDVARTYGFTDVDGRQPW